MRPQNLIKQQPGAIALPDSDDRFNQELAEWFSGRGGVWSGTAAELLAAVKTAAGRGNDLWPRSPRLLYAHVESQRHKLHALGVDVVLHHRFPRIISLRSCGGEKPARKPPLRSLENDPTFDSSIKLPTPLEHQRPISAALPLAAMVKRPLMGAGLIESPRDRASLPRRGEQRDSKKAEAKLISQPAAKLLYDGYGVVENPFGVTPNTRFLYQSGTHAEARSSLIIGIEYGVGFQALIAPPGMGKTTILFNVLERFRDVARTALLFQVQGGSCDFLRYLLSELGSESHDSNLASLQGAVNRLLKQEHLAGRPTIIIVDEAQSLDSSVLETLRMLSNFETTTRKLVHIVLAGQPGLAERLAAPELAQLYQRISILTTLTPFGLEDTRDYIDHRLKIAGYLGPQLFTSSALNLIWEHSGGIPRQINKLCFNALLLATVGGQKQIDSAILEEVVHDFDLDRARFHMESTANSCEILQRRSSGRPSIENTADQPRQTSDETSQTAVTAPEPAIMVPHGTGESDGAICGNSEQTTLDEAWTAADLGDALQATPEASVAEPDSIATAKSEDPSCPNIDSACNLEPTLELKQNFVSDSTFEYDPESGVETDLAAESGVKSMLGLRWDEETNTPLQSEIEQLSRLHSDSDSEALSRAGRRWNPGSHPVQESKPDSSVVVCDPASKPDLKPNPALDKSGLGLILKRWRVHKTLFYLATSILILLFVLLHGGAPLSRSPRSELTPRRELTLGLPQPMPSYANDGKSDTQVWVDIQSGLYYCPGADLYSRTPAGKFTTQRIARLEHFTSASRELCQ